MQMHRKSGRLAAAALTIPLVISACGGGSQPSGPDGGDSNNGDGGGASGGAASAWTLTGAQEDVFRSSFEQWNEANPERQLSAEYFANDAYKEKIRTAVGAGNAPTLIFNWSGGTLMDYVENEEIVPLDEGTADLQERILPSVLDIGRVNDELYAVPNNSTQPVVMYFNREVLDEAGVEGQPETYQELLDTVTALQDAGIESPIALAGQSQWPMLMWIQYLSDRVGGPETFQRVLDGEEGAWSHPDMLEALGMIEELVDMGAFGDTFGSVSADANADVALVHTGQAGMLLQGAWVYASFLDDAPDFVEADGLEFGPFPEVSGGDGDPSNITGNPANFWSVSAAASEEAQSTAMDYLNEAVQDEEYVDQLVAESLVPVTTGAEDAIADAENSDFLTFAYELVQDASHFQLSWDQALSSGEAQELLSNLSALFLEQQSAQEFADAMDAVD